MYDSYYKSLHYDEMGENNDEDDDPENEGDGLLGSEGEGLLGSEVLLDTDDPEE